MAQGYVDGIAEQIPSLVGDRQPQPQLGMRPAEAAEPGRQQVAPQIPLQPGDGSAGLSGMQVGLAQ